jgi:group I intron endonuclease
MKRGSQSGVYRIDGPNGKFYIGSSKTCEYRWRQHQWFLNRGEHPNRMLQRAWTKYGSDAFTFSVIEVVCESLLIETEQKWIDETQACKKGYNIRLIAESNAGLRHSEEAKRKLSEAHMGRKHGPMSEEQKAHYSALYKGRKLSEETRKRMSESRLGRSISDETRKKISESHKGKVVSQETRAKFSAALTGRKHSEETKQKMRESHQRRLHNQPTQPQTAAFSF